MSQLDDVPPIRLPQFSPFPMEDAFRGVSDRFSITTPETPPTGGGGSDAGEEEPQDDESEAEHPFAIQIEITSANPSSKSWAATVTVLSGKYQTDGDTQYTAAEATESFTTASGTIWPYVYLYVPLVPKTGGGWTAVDGGFIVFGANRPSVVWPQVQRTPSGVTEFGTTVPIGTWTIQIANVSEGVATYAYRAVINQIIAEDYVLEQVDLVEGSGPRTFFATGSASDVVVSAGAINNIVVAETTITAPADGTKIYIKVEVDEDGDATSVAVESGSSVPEDTETEGYKLIATVAVTGGVASPTPLGWNYSEMIKCGPETYQWGGFGGG